MVTEVMNMQSKKISQLILEKMEEYPRGTIFTNSDFYDLGGRSAIKTALFRLAKDKKIYRLIDGYYTVPYYSEVIHEYCYPSIHQLTRKIAKKNAWNICACGEIALNQVGLSTQVPTVCEYISDGPYKEYQYFDRVIKFKHTSSRSISNFSEPLATLIQAIKALGKDNITNKDIKIMSYFTNKYIEEDILEETKIIPAWIYQILKEIVEVIKK